MPVEAGTVSPDGLFTADVSFVGEASVTATNATLSATSALHLESFTPGPVATLAMGGAPSALALGDGVVYVGGA